jgi:hypothetical protein
MPINKEIIDKSTRLTALGKGFKLDGQIFLTALKITVFLPVYRLWFSIKDSKPVNAFAHI